MRIVAGIYKSRLIKSPKGVKTRPTKDRIREALFNIIRTGLEGAEVLDGFAGSGAFGIEALSRGARSVTFVDNEGACIRTIEENLFLLGIEQDENVKVVRMDMSRAVDILCRRGAKYDFILLDPPYYKDMVKKCLIKLSEHDILKPRCIIVAEHHKRDVLPKELDNITCYRAASYGEIVLSFFKKKGAKL